MIKYIKKRGAIVENIKIRFYDRSLIYFLKYDTFADAIWEEFGMKIFGPYGFMSRNIQERPDRH